ncbi:MAG: GTPase Era [Lysobacteraceae bacterium]|nr:MAG: GTPase Era [Xanthomonadaceae bacterium]
MTAYKAGLVALVGRPNVGKSTLLNRILGEHLSIVAPRPQTTRHRIAGIHSTEQGQIVFLDTPGIHSGQKKALNRYMNRVAAGSLAEADVVVVIVQAMKLTDEDRKVIQLAERAAGKAILVINKVDLVPNKDRLLPFVQEVSMLAAFDAVLMVCARRGNGFDRLEQALYDALPESEPLYEDDQLTDRSERFLAAEMVREPLMVMLDEELPYGVTVEIEQFEREGQLLRISACIWVERDSHKGMVVGKGGQQLKRSGQRARETMERFFQCKVFLKLWVKVRANWADDERQLASFGYDDA